MSAQAVEYLLARLYADVDLLQRFLESPQATARTHSLDEAEIQALAAIDTADLRLAARSYAHKRMGRRKDTGHG